MKDKIKQIKYSRLKEEELVIINIFGNIKRTNEIPYYGEDESKYNYNDIVSYVYGRYEFIKNKHQNVLYISENLWGKLSIDYGYDHDETKKLLTKYLNYNPVLNWYGLRPDIMIYKI